MKKQWSAWVLAGLLAFGALSPSLANYSAGSQGQEVRNIQRRLSSAGYKVKADGKFGSATTTAVKKFQAKKHLDVDGVVGPATYKALMGKPMPKSAVRMRVAAPEPSAQKPCIGVSLLSPSPRVRMTFQPPVTVPRAISP